MINPDIQKLIASELNLQERYVAHALALLEGGCTVPFISRYRKEATGGMDEMQVAAVAGRLDKLKEIEERKQTILSTIEAQGKLTDALRSRILSLWDPTVLEDLYLPYKPKRRTRAQMARERGLEPLADWLMMQRQGNVRRQAGAFVRPDKEVKSTEEALQGAMDILAERVSEDERARNRVRAAFRREAVITSRVVKGKEEEGQKYLDYFDFSERLARCASHRMLALRRGETEGVLKLSIGVEDEACTERLIPLFVRRGSEASGYVEQAVRDAYKRLLEPSIETEFFTSSKVTADEAAIRTFVRNLEQLLMAAPLGQKRVMGVDPRFRTGCKVVCLDSEGNLLHFEALYPHTPQERRKASERMRNLLRLYRVEAISVGNGTAGRETEAWLRSLPLPAGVELFVVSEDGASVYSASKVAREEFPDRDVTVRGAVSIARRLMDPLSELVKIDPSSIGVGQYQKDVNQTDLKKSLDQTVVSCVNRVGVNVNVASRHLLMYVSGLGPLLAQNIVDYRAANGAFHTRKDLLKVPRMGPKAFEQSAGFLRIPDGGHPLDNSAVHPERYALVEQMAQDLGCSVAELMADPERRKAVDVNRYVSDSVGLPTLQDILKELEKPGRDPRQKARAFAFSPEVKTLEDLRVGMVLPGLVNNITDFGCFVDVGVHTSGLVHVSEMAERFVKDPAEICTLHQAVMVRVIGVDLQRKRLQLSMKGLSPADS